METKQLEAVKAYVLKSLALCYEKGKVVTRTKDGKTVTYRMQRHRLGYNAYAGTRLDDGSRYNLLLALQAREVGNEVIAKAIIDLYYDCKIKISSDNQRDGKPNEVAILNSLTDDKARILYLQDTRVSYQTSKSTNSKRTVDSSLELGNSLLDGLGLMVDEREVQQ